MGPETAHKPPISIHTKIYLRSFVDYQYHLYIWNITLNYCFIFKSRSGVTLYGNAPEYPSNTHNLAPLFPPIWKIVNNSVPLIMSFKVLKYFSNDKISFFLFASLLKRDLKLKKLMFFFSETLTDTTVGLIEKGLLFSGKILVCGWNFAFFGS